MEPPSHFCIVIDLKHPGKQGTGEMICAGSPAWESPLALLPPARGLAVLRSLSPNTTAALFP